MGNKDNAGLKKIADLLNQPDSTYSIFEDQIDINVQKEFYEYLESLTPSIKQEENNSLDEIDLLYSKDSSEEEKKKILVLLANLNEVKAYRAIERYTKEGDKNLRKWSVVALQQSRMMLESSLLDEKSVFISTGLGGKGNKLRYFCVFFTHNQEELQTDKQNTLRKEIEFAFNKEKAELETLEFTKGIVIFKALIPIKTDLKELFDTIITEINNYGKLLKDNIIITNVKSLTISEINKILNTESEE